MRLPWRCSVGLMRQGRSSGDPVGGVATKLHLPMNCVCAVHGIALCLAVVWWLESCSEWGEAEKSQSL